MQDDDLTLHKAEIARLVSEQKGNYYLLGEQFFLIKQKLAHGEFQPWIKRNVPGFTYQTVHNYMRVYALCKSVNNPHLVAVLHHGPPRGARDRSRGNVQEPGPRCGGDPAGEPAEGDRRGRRPARRHPCRDRVAALAGRAVSVVIPTFERKAKLLRCLDALRAQTVLPQELEVLVVDDGSSDGTTEALAACETPFELRRFRQPNQGPGAARNLGWDAVHQTYLAFLDADDAWHPRKLELQIGWMEAHPEVALTGTQSLVKVEWRFLEEVQHAQGSISA